MNHAGDFVKTKPIYPLGNKPNFQTTEGRNLSFRQAPNFAEASAVEVDRIVAKW